MNIPRKLPLASAAVVMALLAPLSAQQDWIAWSTVNGTADTDQFSLAIAPLGDWNQDGYDDYAISSPGSDALFQNGGAVTIHSGLDDSILMTIGALGAGEQLGFCLESLGTHDADGLPKLAIGAPFATTANGPFSGFVRVYAWDNSTSTLNLVEDISGLAAGNMFGASLAGYDRDGDGDLDLAVGAIGANFQDGQVLAFNMSSAGVALPAAATFDGAFGTAEMFGWSITRVDATGLNPPAGTNGEGLAVGVPFADDIASEAGAVIVIDEFGVMTQITNPLASTADSHLGYSISGGLDALGTAATDLAAGAPDTANGNVVVWSGEDFSVSSNLVGDNVGDRYGFSMSLIRDTNFDAKADVAIGAPGFLSERGALHVSEVAVANSSLYSATGIAGTNGQFGFTVSSLGDINQTSKEEVGVGAAWLANDRGRLEVFAPPVQDIGPIDLVASGSFNWATDVVIDVSNLSDGVGGDLYWYVGTSLSNSVSNEGYDLNISNGGSTPATLYALTVSTGSTAQTLLPLEDNIADGTVLYFQLIEDRNGFVRTSNVDGDAVTNPGVSIFVEGNQAPGTAIVSTRWGHPNSPIYLYATPYGFTAAANNSVPNYNWTINLRNPIYIGSTTSTDMSGNPGAPDEGDFTSDPIQVPAAAAGRTIHFQAYDWDLFNPQRTNVLGVDFQ